MKKKHNIYILFHVALLNDWQSLVAEQLLKIRDSGLYDLVTAIFVSVVGGGAQFFSLKDKKVGIIYRSEDPQVYEYPAIDFLRNFIEKDDACYILYMHTKGISYEPSSPERSYADSWRNYMEYFLIENHRTCLALLGKYDVCGVQWTDSYYASADYYYPHHYQGNFWWATGSYINRLSDPRLIPCGSRLKRMQPEFWIGSGANVNACSLFRLEINLYYQLADSKLYRGVVAEPQTFQEHQQETPAVRIDIHYEHAFTENVNVNDPVLRASSKQEQRMTTNTKSAQFKLNISYVVFNAEWDSFLLHMGVHNSQGLYRMSSGPATNSELYITYLRNSIASLAAAGMPERTTIDIWVLELEHNCFIDRLKDALFDIKAPDCIRLQTVDRDLVEHLIRHELQAPHHLHKSPNKIHEFLIYHIVEAVEEQYVYIPDVDTLFLSSGFIDLNLKLLKDRMPSAACSFMDLPRDVQRGKGLIRIPERMHTVSLFFDVVSLRKHIDLRRDAALQLDFQSRITVLKNPETRLFFDTSKHADTLSFMTEQLKQHNEGNLLIPLNENVPFYFEDLAMTIGCPYFLHGKYLDMSVHRMLLRQYSQHPESLRNYLKAFNRAVSLPPVPPLS